MRALLWLAAALLMLVFLIFIYALISVGTTDDDEMEGTPMVQPEETPLVWELPKVTVRFPVPLDAALQQYIVDQCKAYSVSVSYVLAIIDKESNFDAGLIGDNGKSYGLMQIKAEDHTDRCIRLGAYNLLNPYQNVTVGIDYFAELLAEENGVEWALMAYNGGPGYADDRVASGVVTEYVEHIKQRAEYYAEQMMMMVEEGA